VERDRHGAQPGLDRQPQHLGGEVGEPCEGLRHAHALGGVEGRRAEAEALDERVAEAAGAVQQNDGAPRLRDLAHHALGDLLAQGPCPALVGQERAAELDEEGGGHAAGTAHAGLEFPLLPRRQPLSEGRILGGADVGPRRPGGALRVGLPAGLRGGPGGGAAVHRHPGAGAHARHRGGAAASLGYLDPWVVFAVASAGAIAGDFCAYGMGRSKGRGLLERHGARFGLTPSRVGRAQELLRRNPFVAIVGGRFSAVTRAIVPFVAGCLSFRLGRFTAYNLVGGILWAGSSVLLGLLVGTGYHAAEHVLGRLLLAAVLGLAGLYLAYRVVRWVSPLIRRADAVAFLAAAAGVALFWVATENVAEGDNLARLDLTVQASWTRTTPTAWAA